MAYQEFFSALAIVLTFAAFVPYVHDIYFSVTRPHVLSWMIWGVTTFVVFLAQIEGGGGIGAWPIGISALITLCIAALAYVRRFDITIQKSDWLVMAVAVSSLILWYLTSNPLSAVIIITLVDLGGFVPTIRKVYLSPFSEPLIFFAFIAIRNLLVVLALKTQSLTTVLFPVAIGCACISVIAVAAFRRRHQQPTK